MTCHLTQRSNPLPPRPTAYSPITTWPTRPTVHPNGLQPTNPVPRRYTISTVAALAGAGEPQALSYWAISDVFEESFFPVHNESFHGMFGMVNLHGVPKPTYRAYQILHETGDTRLAVAGPSPPKPIPPSGQCGAIVPNTDVWGGEIVTKDPCSTCGLFTMEDCCGMCLEQNEQGKVCDTAELWHAPGDETHGYRCALKQFADKTNITANPGRSYVRITGRKPTPRPSNDDLCALNAGVLAVKNGSAFVDLLIYNHAAFADPIVDCSMTVKVPGMSKLAVSHPSNLLTIFLRVLALSLEPSSERHFICHSTALHRCWSDITLLPCLFVFFLGGGFPCQGRDRPPDRRDPRQRVGGLDRDGGARLHQRHAERCTARGLGAGGREAGRCRDRRGGAVHADRPDARGRRGPHRNLRDWKDQVAKQQHTPDLCTAGRI